MSDEQTIDLSNVINVSILSAQSGLGLPNVNTAALLTRETKPGSWGSLAFKVYKNSSEVLTDWGSASPVYTLAVSFFAQQPNVLTTNGYLVVIPALSDVDVAASLTLQDLTFAAKTAGVAGNSISIEYVDAPAATVTIQSLVYDADATGKLGNGISVSYTTGATAGAEVVTVSGKHINVQIDTGNTSATQLKAAIDGTPAAAALVNVTILAGQGATKQTGPVSTTYLAGGIDKGGETVDVASSAITVTMVDGETDAADIKRAIDNDGGASALVSVALSTGHETDVQDAPDGPTTLSGGLASSDETLPAAIARTMNSVYYFGVLVDEVLAESPLVALAAYMQTIDKVLFYASRTAADFAPAGMLDDVRTASETHTRCLYYYSATPLDTQKFAAAYAGRALSTNFAGINTAQTMHLKSLAGITPDQTIDQTALEAAVAAGVDVYCSMAGVPSLFTSGENAFFDQVYNSLWFKFALQTAAFNFLRETNTKIPQTEEGMEGLKSVLRGVCAQAAGNGFIGRGSWTSSTVFGNPADLIRNISDQGYYVYSQPVANQAQSDRTDRRAPLVQIAVKEQGAIHSSSIIVNVNQ
jgi:hypothetical protein